MAKAQEYGNAYMSLPEAQHMISPSYPDETSNDSSGVNHKSLLRCCAI